MGLLRESCFVDSGRQLRPRAVCCGVQGQWYGVGDLFPIFCVSQCNAGARLSLTYAGLAHLRPKDRARPARRSRPVLGPRAAQPLLTSTSFPLAANRAFHAPVLREPFPHTNAPSCISRYA